MISYICDEYVALALSKLSTYMRLSEATAGKTFVALANGIGDVLTIIVASQRSADSGVSHIAIGSLFGASLFTTTVIVCFVIFYSSNHRIEGVNKISNSSRAQMSRQTLYS